MKKKIDNGEANRKAAKAAAWSNYIVEREAAIEAEKAARVKAADVFARKTEKARANLQKAQDAYNEIAGWGSAAQKAQQAAEDEARLELERRINAAWVEFEKLDVEGTGVDRFHEYQRARRNGLTGKR